MGRSRQRSTGQITRFFGNRHKQLQLSAWGISDRSKFTITEIPPSTTWGKTKSRFAPQNRDVKILGISFGRREIDFVRTRYVNQMGRVEDIAVGYGYSMSIGYGSPLYGSDRSETVLNWLFSSSLVHHDWFFLNTHADYTTRLSNGPRESVFKGRI